MIFCLRPAWASLFARSAASYDLTAHTPKIIAATSEISCRIPEIMVSKMSARPLGTSTVELEKLITASNVNFFVLYRIDLLVSFLVHLCSGG